MKFTIVLAAFFAAMAYAAPSGVSGNILGGDSSNDDNAVNNGDNGNSGECEALGKSCRNNSDCCSDICIGALGLCI
ncbi:hypothetical protein LTR70_002759 [Exophiala xenobiotica]|uniref:Uncharacterized protein n=1 Tax=Lithohypha guttulata TaxID=1690604 RepID=A0ABR0KLB9_9EURO|nr:hypothetical protein LTR24_001866 [Lithohypha guttulata]KAK5324685.1 hypothetical protein LTR70_002759 [Exophiala xenobiotica]